VASLRGLKSLGVRDQTYKIAFLASSIQPSNPTVCFIIIMEVYKNILIKKSFGKFL